LIPERRGAAMPTIAAFRHPEESPMKLQSPAGRGGRCRTRRWPRRRRPRPQTLRWAAQNDILTLDPHSQNHATTNAILMHAYEGLTRYNAQVPGRARAGHQVDLHQPDAGALRTAQGRQVPRRLALHRRRRGLLLRPHPQPQGTMQIYVTGISEIKKIDDHTVDFILSAPNPILLRNIIDFRIMSKAWAEKNTAANVQDYKAKEENFASRNAMGTGPYKITGWTPEQRITMTRQQRLVGQAQGNVKEVVYTPIKSEATRVAALLSGDVDMLTDLPTQDVARLRDAKLKISTAPRCAPSSWPPTSAAPS
jgi:peptide/nickel transport system substrate-binding protein